MGAGEQTLSANLNRRSRRLPGLRVVPYQSSASAPSVRAFTTAGARAERDARPRHKSLPAWTAGRCK
jgi:hypothetical protein